MRILCLAALALACTAEASPNFRATVTSSDGTPVTYVAAAGASLELQCVGYQVNVLPGSAGSPPTASATSPLVDFVQNVRPFTIQLATNEDRISIKATRSFGFVCQVFTQTVPAVTSSSLSNCLSIKHTVVSVGADGGTFAVPVTPQSGRRYVEICVSAENSGSPKVKCMTDPAAGKPQLGLAEPGDVLQIGVQPCATYPVDSTHLSACVSDTAGTAVTVDECVSP